MSIPVKVVADFSLRTVSFGSLSQTFSRVYAGANGSVEVGFRVIFSATDVDFYVNRYGATFGTAPSTTVIAGSSLNEFGYVIPYSNGTTAYAWTLTGADLGTADARYRSVTGAPTPLWQTASRDVIVDVTPLADGRMAALIDNGANLRLVFQNSDGSGTSSVALGAASGGASAQFAQQSDGKLQIFVPSGSGLLIATVDLNGNIYGYFNTASRSFNGAPVIDVVASSSELGGAVQVWTDFNGSNTSQWVIKIHYNGGSGGNGGDFVVASGTLPVSGTFVDHNPQISRLIDGRYIVVWDDGGAIYGRVIAQSGNFFVADSLQFNVSATAGGISALRPSITTMADGRVAIAWDELAGGVTSGRMAIFDPRETGVVLNAPAISSEYVGSNFADTITGNVGNDVFIGGAGADIITGAGGNDALDGGVGADTALWAGVRSNYYIRSFASSGVIYTQVAAASGTDGVDLIVNVETLGFANGGQAFGLAGIQQNLVSNMDGSYFDDVLFQNSATGQISFQNMNAGSASGFTNVLGSLPSGWRLVGSADFTGDGRADVLVQDTNSGSIYTVNIASGTPVWGTVNTLLTGAYQAIACGDVTRDGTTDVLVRDNTSGQTFIADIDAGGAFGGWVLGPNLGTGWRTVGLGDFNRDGASDVLVQNIADGTTYYRDVANGQWGAVAGAVGSQWVAREAADINGDGYTDVIFRNSSTGDIWSVNMLGGSNAGWGVVANGLTGWDVRGSADVDNDGYRDIIIQNLADGTTYYADMNNGTFNGWGSVTGALGTQWLAVG